MLSNRSIFKMNFSDILKKNIIMLEKGQNLKSFINSNPTLVVDYFAKWCKACKTISPKLEELINSNEKVKLLKVNVDIHNNLIQQEKLSVLPTIALYRDGTKKIEIKGSDLTELENYIKKI